jgi:undecaprenyl-diphosphatase
MIQQIAQLLGMYALPIFIAFVVVVLAFIFLFWRLFEAHYRRFWEWGSRIWHFITHLLPTQWLRQRYPRLWSFLGRRLSSREYLGLHLTLGLLIIVTMLNAFGEIADSVTESEGIAHFDRALAHSMYQHVSPTAIAAFRGITWLGDPELITVIVVMVGAMLLAGRYWYLLAGWVIIPAGGGLLNSMLKAIFQRNRPELPNPFVVEMSWSFPSGHAMGSLITYGMLAYVLVVFLERRWDRPVIAATVTLVLLIGFSRMYLGVHYFSDVVAGFAAGTAWLTIGITGIETARRYRYRRRSPQPVIPRNSHSYHSR